MVSRMVWRESAVNKICYISSDAQILKSASYTLSLCQVDRFQRERYANQEFVFYLFSVYSSIGWFLLSVT